MKAAGDGALCVGREGERLVGWWWKHITLTRFGCLMTNINWVWVDHLITQVVLYDNSHESLPVRWADNKIENGLAVLNYVRKMNRVDLITSTLKSIMISKHAPVKHTIADRLILEFTYFSKFSHSVVLEFLKRTKGLFQITGNTLSVEQIVNCHPDRRILRTWARLKWNHIWMI